MTPVHSLELILLLIGTMLALAQIGGRLGLPPAAALLLGGMGLALIPGMPSIHLDADLMLVLFLPPLLLSAAFETVWSDFKAQLRPILLLSFGAVVFTTLSVGIATHLVLPTLSWAACFTLGAIVSPPDAVAAKAVLKRLKLPRRIVTILEGESLVNDASSLVLYRLAAAAALSGAFNVGNATATFAWLAIAGIGVGVVVAAIFEVCARRMRDSTSVVIASFLVGYVSYIAAERLHASGVLAVVACGLVMGWRQHLVLNAHGRTEGRIVWELAVFVLEALVFILMGLALRPVLTRMGGDLTAIWNALPLLLAVNGAAIASRIVWVFLSAYSPGLHFLRIRRREPSPPAAVPVVIAWSGMRGVVSLAPALALPVSFPGRDVLLLAAFSVIVVTLLGQGLTLGPLIRALGRRLPAETSSKTLDETSARRLIDTASLEALAALEASRGRSAPFQRLLRDYRERVELSDAADGGGSGEREKDGGSYRDAAMIAITRGRGELRALKTSDRIHESVARRLEQQLDAEETDLNRLNYHRT